MTRFIAYILTPIMILGFSIGFLKGRYWKDFERWAITEIKNQAWEHAEIKLDVEGFGIRAFPLAVTLNKITIQPPKKVRPYLAPILIDEVGANLSLWSALQGQLRIGTLDISHPQIRMIVKDKTIKQSTSTENFDLFNLLHKIPITNLEIKDLDWIGRVDSTNLVFKTSNLRLKLENNKNSLYSEIETSSFLLKPPGPRRGVELQTNIRFLLEPKRILLGALKIKHSESIIVGSGEGQIEQPFKLEQTLGSMRMKLNFNDLQEWMTVFYPALKNLKGSGQLDLNVDIEMKKSVPTANIKIETKDLDIDGYKVGTLTGQGKLNDKQLSIPEIKIEHPAGKLQISSIEANFPDKKASFKLKTDRLDVSQLLENIHVKGVPLQAFYSGDMPCEASLEKNWNLNCKGSMVGESVHLWSEEGKTKTTIVQLGQHRADGQLTVDSEKVQYSTQLKLGKDSHGSSDGVIHYENGFKINFKGDQVLFSDVQNFVNLHFVGKTQMQGSTQGGSRSATFQMDLKAQDFELEKYKLGQIDTQLNYQSGVLAFSNFKAQIGNSQYGGKIDILFNPMRIKFDVNAPYLELKDLQYLLSETFPLPAEITGSGQAQVQGEGPLDFWKLNYDLKSQFFRGAIAGENYDQITANLSARDGRILSNQVQLKKGNGIIDVQGKIDPNKSIDAVLLGRKLALDQSELLSQKGIQASGLVDFTLTLRGVLPNPTYDLNGRISQTVLGDNSLEDSQFHWLSQGNQGTIEAQLFGQQFLFSSHWTGEDWNQFEVKAKAKNWDFSPLLYLFSRPQAGYDLATEIDGEMSLKSTAGGLWNSDGQINLERMSLRRGSIQIENNDSMLISVQKGHFISQNMHITGGGDQYLKLVLNDLHQERIDASLNGRLDLSFLGFTTPFLDELKGPFNLSLAWKGKAQDVSFSGSAFAEKGFVKIHGFPHPISDIKADLLFNNRDILINSIAAKMNSGVINGDGKVSWLGAQNFPLNIQAQFQKVTLNFPEGFKTTGSGQLSLKGSQFPLAFSIDYDIDGGEITSDFNQSGGDNVKTSPYLPKDLTQSQFEPFVYNIDLNILSSVFLNNYLAQTPVRGRLKINGPLSKLEFAGTLHPQAGGKIFFRDQPFEISTGFFEYDQVPADNPKLYLTAFARVSEYTVDDNKNQVKNDYDINMLLQGRGRKPQITWNSQPPLSQPDIVSLVALGVTNSSMQKEGSGRLAGGTTSSALGAAVLQKPLGKELKNRFGVDLKVSSAQPSADTASVPKVTLSKQVSKQLGASASRTIGGSQQVSNVKLEYKLNRRTSVIGTWEGREDSLEQQKDVNKSVFGLDLEYRINFK